MVNKKLVAIGVGAGVVTLGVLVGRKLLSKAGSAHAAAPSAVDLSFATTVADSLDTRKASQRGDAGEDGKLQRLRYFFLYRRALDQGLADATLRVSPGLATLHQRVAQQLSQVEQFLAPLIGTATARGPYFGGPRDPARPIHHLDLGLYVSVRLLDPPPTTEAAAVAASSPSQQQTQTLRELDARKMRVAAIVWRAAAIDADLWSGTVGNAQLKTAELTQLLDRRLRAVERLHYEVSAATTEERLFHDTPENNPSTTQGPWVDSFLVHAFERPSMPRSARSNNGSWAAEEFILGQGKLGQTLSIFDATSGSLTLGFDGEVSAPIPFNATSAEIRDAILSMNDLGPVELVCSGGPLMTDKVQIRLTGMLKPDSQFRVVANSLAGGAEPPALFLGVPDLVFDAETNAVPRFNLVASGGIGMPRQPMWYLNRSSDEFDWNVWPGTRVAGPAHTGAPRVSPFWKLTPEANFKKGYGWNLLPPSFAQSITITKIPKGGTFTLTFGGQPTTELAHTTTAAMLRKALAALPGGGPDVICMDGPLPETITLYFREAGAAALAEGTNNLTTDAGNPKPELQIGARSATSGDQPAQIIDELFALLVPSREGPPDTHGNPTTTPGFNRRDWWERSWLHSDGVMAALHIEALRFALMRQAVASPGTRLDDEFNVLPWKHSLSLDDCFELRRVAHVPDSIMGPGKNDYFENGTAALDDLQIGDQVLFDTSPALVALGTTAWDYPTLLVTDIDTSADKPGIDLGGLKVQGFGTEELDLPAYQLLQAGITDAVLKRVQDYIPAEIARQRAAAAAENQPFTSPTTLRWDIGILSDYEIATGDDTVLRLWNPYGDTWDEPGPWWIWINLHTPLWRTAFGIKNDDDGYALTGSTAAILARMPGALIWTQEVYDPDTDVEDDDSDEDEDDDGKRLQFANYPNPWRATGASPILRIGPGFQPPPIRDAHDFAGDQNDSILIPLFQPMGGWESYFDAKFRTPADSRWPTQLDPVKADARWFSGFAKSPTNPAHVRVIRPRAKPTPTS